METLVTGGPRKKDLETRKANMSASNGSHASKDWQLEDGTSETGIIQTKTTEVTFTAAK